MRRTVMVAAVSALAMLGAGCAANGGEAQDGPMATRGFQVGQFRSIALGGSQDVVVTVGGAPSVRAEGPQRELDRLEIAVVDGALRIDTRGSGWLGFGGGERQGVTIHVTVPSLEAAEIGGSGAIQVDKVEGQRFAGTVGGSGDLRVGRMRVNEAHFSVGGSGSVTAAGVAQRAAVDLAGSGDIDLGGLDARQATVSLAGSGDVTARAAETAEVNLAGSGDVTIAGAARCTIEKHGSGDVHCGNAA